MEACLDEYLTSLEPDTADESGDEWDALDWWLACWRGRAAGLFEELYNKEEALASGDEMALLLMGDRDDNMSKKAVECMNKNDGVTRMIVSARDT